MGCASSKQPRCCGSSKQHRCRHCRHCGRNPTLSRCNSMPLNFPVPFPVPVHVPVPVHHPAQRNGDSYHVVALTSTTLGSLKLDSPLHNHYNHHEQITTNCTTLCFNEEDEDNYEESDDVFNYNREKKQRNRDSNGKDMNKSNEVFSREIRLAKTWSDMIHQKIPKVIPKTPIRTPPGEPENINTWELMEGLEDSSQLPSPTLTDPESRFSFKVVPNFSSFEVSSPRLKQENGNGMTIPQWLQISNSDPDPNPQHIVSGFDPEIISTFRKALEDISPTNTSLFRSPEEEKIGSPVNNRWCLILSSKEEEVDTDTHKASNSFECRCPPNGEDKVVIYFTSLRGVRKTYEDCCQVRVIMKGLGVRLDERDVSMHGGFKEELKELLGAEYRGGGLPKVFVKGKFIGGVDEIKQLHEDGALEKLVHGCEKLDDSMGGGICEACGDVRFVPCERCSGSCKIYYEVGDEEEEEEDDEECGFVRCPDCNENGIVRCPICCC